MKMLVQSEIEKNNVKTETTITPFSIQKVKV